MESVSEVIDSDVLIVTDLIILLEITIITTLEVEVESYLVDFP